MGLFRRNKNNNKPLIRQILDLVPRWIFDSCTNTYKTDKGCSKYKTYDQFVALTFGQLNKCQILNDISAGIGVSEIFIDDLNLKQSPARSTMSDGNKNRDWRVFESLYYRLLSHYKSVLKQHHNTHIIKEIKGKVIKLIDSSTISLCLAMFDWAEFRTAKGGIKLHTSGDYNSQIFVALINYLLIELIKRTISKKKQLLFQVYVKKSGSVCITIYHWIMYVMNSGRVFARLLSLHKKKWSLNKTYFLDNLHVVTQTLG
jgi:hypothetical protein